MLLPAYCIMACRQPCHRTHSLVGHVDARVARVGAVADRQEVDLVVAAAAPQP